MLDSGSWGETWLYSEISDIDVVSLEWTSTESVRLVAAVTKSNPIDPNWEHVSTLMKTQPEARQRVGDFYDAQNCSSHFHFLQQKYSDSVISNPIGGGVYSAEHLLSLLASDALLEKAHLLGKADRRATDALSTSLVDDFGDIISYDSSASTLDINADTIFENAVQYESPAESLSDNYFHFASMDKTPKLVLSGPIVLAKKSNPKNSEASEKNETRHFNMDLFKKQDFSQIATTNEKDFTSKASEISQEKTPASRSRKNSIPTKISRKDRTKESLVDMPYSTRLQNPGNCKGPDLSVKSPKQKHPDPKKPVKKDKVCLVLESTFPDFNQGSGAVQKKMLKTVAELQQMGSDAIPTDIKMGMASNLSKKDAVPTRPSSNYPQRVPKKTNFLKLPYRSTSLNPEFKVPTDLPKKKLIVASKNRMVECPVEKKQNLKSHEIFQAPCQVQVVETLIVSTIEEVDTSPPDPNQSTSAECNEDCETAEIQELFEIPPQSEQQMEEDGKKDQHEDNTGNPSNKEKNLEICTRKLRSSKSKAVDEHCVVASDENNQKEPEIVENGKEPSELEEFEVSKATKMVEENVDACIPANDSQNEARDSTATSSATMTNITPKSVASPSPSKDDLMFLFRQAIAITPKEFYGSATTGFPEGVSAIKEPMDLYTIKGMLEEGKITTVAQLDRNLGLTFFNGFMVHHEDHPVSKKAIKAMQELAKLFAEHRAQYFAVNAEFATFLKEMVPITPEMVENNLTEMFGKERADLLLSASHLYEMRRQRVQRSLSPDITELPCRDLRRKILKIRRKKTTDASTLAAEDTKERQQVE